MMTGSEPKVPTTYAGRSHWQMFIDGDWVDGAESRRHELVDPAAGAGFATVADASGADIDCAVAAARRSFANGIWRSVPPKRRADVLLRLADLVDRDRDAYARAETLNNGMPLPQAAGMVARCVAHLQYMASAGQRALGETIPGDARFTNYSVREPVGVCALIVPWNGPLISAVWKMAPALALGNSVVLKTSELTPVTALMLARHAAEAGIPDGAFNVVVGDGEAGGRLVSHADVDKIAFTGSTVTGTKVMVAAAQNISNVTLELGGKSPHIFFDDVSVETAVAASISGLLLNTGQVCVAGSRILVQQSMMDEFIKALVVATERLVLGAGLDPRTQLGPVISRAHLNRVLSYIQIGIDEGAQLLCGGCDAPDTPKGGFFVRPTWFLGDNEMRISREEIFGPIGVVIPFSNEQEAIRLANDTSFGLAAGVWTSDGSRALRVANALRAGNVWVNTYGYNFAESPLGGYGRSGIGRENGTSVIDTYTELKNVVIDTSGRPLDIFGTLAHR